MAGTAARLYVNRWAAAAPTKQPVLYIRGVFRPKEKEKDHDIPGVEPITYAGKMHYVPWLAKPKPQEWKRDWHDPYHSKGPRLEEMPLHKTKPCFIFHQQTRVLEGVTQALWLTKSKLIDGLPERIQKISEASNNQFENQDEQVLNIISRAILWSTKDKDPKREKFCPILLRDLLLFCTTLNCKYPMLSRRALAENYRPSSTWTRESDLFQVRGINGTLLSAKNPLDPLASQEDIRATEKHVLQTFYPVAPTIDLQIVNVYKEVNDTGFHEGYPYAYPHTLYFTDLCTPPECGPFKPEHLRAKMIMFAFGNALAKAKILYGEDAKVLDHPVVVQSVATNGKLFQFVVFQLNTTDLNSSDGVKNIVWMDSDQMLYDYNYDNSYPKFYRKKNRKKKEPIPSSVPGYQPETFGKFLAMYLHGVL